MATLPKLQRLAEAVGCRLEHSPTAANNGWCYPSKWPYSIYIEPVSFLGCYGTLEEAEAALRVREAKLRGVGTKRYRYVDGYNEPLRLEYTVVRKTPAGAWIVDYYSAAEPLAKRSLKELREDWGARFVLDGDGRRWAHETDALARSSYRIRKQRQIQHSKAAIERAEAALRWLDTGELPQSNVFQFTEKLA